MVIFKRGLGCLEYNLKRNHSAFHCGRFAVLLWACFWFCFGFLVVFLVVF